MKLVHSQSRWGNLYNSRYYKDGKRISVNDYQWEYAKNISRLLNKTDEQTSFGYRLTHNFA